MSGWKPSKNNYRILENDVAQKVYISYLEHPTFPEAITRALHAKKANIIGSYTKTFLERGYIRETNELAYDYYRKKNGSEEWHAMNPETTKKRYIATAQPFIEYLLEKNGLEPNPFAILIELYFSFPEVRKRILILYGVSKDILKVMEEELQSLLRNWLYYSMPFRISRPLALPDHVEQAIKIDYAKENGKIQGDFVVEEDIQTAEHKILNDEKELEKLTPLTRVRVYARIFLRGEKTKSINYEKFLAFAQEALQIYKVQWRGFEALAGTKLMRGEDNEFSLTKQDQLQLSFCYLFQDELLGIVYYFTDKLSGEQLIINLKDFIETQQNRLRDLQFKTKMLDPILLEIDDQKSSQGEKTPTVDDIIVKVLEKTTRIKRAFDIINLLKFPKEPTNQYFMKLREEYKTLQYECFQALLHAANAFPDRRKKEIEEYIKNHENITNSEYLLNLHKRELYPDPFME